MKNVQLIVAHDLMLGIGMNGMLPWSIKADLERFKRLTLGTAVIMGRKTWDSLPPKNRPLKDRFNIVITSRDSLFEEREDLRSAKTFEEGIEIAKKTRRRIILIGGYSIYKHALDLGIVDEISVTVVDSIFKCNTKMPEYRNGLFVRLYTVDNFEGDIKLSFETWVKK